MSVRILLVIIVVSTFGCDPAWQIRMDVREGATTEVRELKGIPAGGTFGSPIKDARIEMTLRSSSGGDFGRWIGKSEGDGSAIFSAAGPWGNEELWGDFVCSKPGFQTVSGTCRFERWSGEPPGKSTLVIMPRQEKPERNGDKGPEHP